MKLYQLTLREIAHRKWSFSLGLLSVAVAVGCLVASLTVLRSDTIQTYHILLEKQREVNAAVVDKQKTVAVTVANKRKEVKQSLADKQKQVKNSLANKEKEVAQRLKNKQAELDKLIVAREKEVKAAGVAANDAIRKITKGLGFNVWILPANQDLNELYTEGKLSKTMTEEHVKTLSNSKIMTINHLLPMLMHKLTDWQGPKTKQTIHIIGTRGEVPLSHRTAKKPLKDGKEVKPDEIVIGFEIADQQKLKVGDKLKLLGTDFTVKKVHGQRGTADDSTVWINLKVAQKALKKENLINAILALECNCASEDRIGDIRKDLNKLLPGTKVIERDSKKALARAVARQKAKKAADAALKSAQANAKKLVAQEKSFGKTAIEKERKHGEELLKQEQKHGRAMLNAEIAAGNATIAKAKLEGDTEMQRERDARSAQQDRRESFVAILVPLVIAGAAVWIALLTYLNVRQRQSEIGILRAIGLRSGDILKVFLTKALLIGIIGAVVGYSLGYLIGGGLSELPGGESAFDWQPLLFAFLAAPCLSCLAGWIPAMMAAQQDPALVLQGD